MEIQIVGLDMELVNALISAVTVLAKLTIGASIAALILWGIVLILGIFFHD